MRLVTFSRAGRAPRVGAALGPWDAWASVVDLHGLDNRIPADMVDFIDACGSLSGPAWSRAMRAVARAEKTREARSRFVHGPSSVRLHAPLAPRLLRDFIAFRGHIARTRAALGGPFPAEWERLPAYYNGNHLSILGPGEPVPVLEYPVYAAAGVGIAATAKLDYEAEIGFVIGVGGRHVPESKATEHLFGVTIFNDFSARDIQAVAMKVGLGPPPGKDWANALGPCIVTCDEFGPLEDQRVAVRVNGAERMAGTYRDLVYKNPFVGAGQRAGWTFDEMVAFVSRGQEVHAGEVWGSGTIPGGCELERGDRAVYLRPGDIVEIEVEGIGVLSNPIAPSDRSPSWAIR